MNSPAPANVPDVATIPWRIALVISWGTLRRRVFRSLITMTGVILAIAFLTYMLVTQNVTGALVVANRPDLNALLQKAGVDILNWSGTDSRLMLLIGLSLLTCLVGIVNAMLMSVTERIREIGTMKCLGASSQFIIRIYFIEAALQGLMGTLFGLLIGSLVAVLAAVHAYGFAALQVLSLSGLSGSLGMSAIVGIGISVLAAIAPAYWAAKKEPVDAMRVAE